MKNLLFKSLLIFCVFSSKALHASDTNITAPSTSAIVVDGDDQAINITGNGNLIGTSDQTCDLDDFCTVSAPIMNSDGYVGTTITVNTTYLI